MPSLAGDILTDLANRAGWPIWRESTYGYVGRIDLPSGRQFFFHHWQFDLNPQAAVSLARDKDFCLQYLAALNWPTPPGRAFYSAKWARAIGSNQTINQAIAYANSLSWPVIVKANSRAGGQLVYLARQAQELNRAARMIFKFDKIMRVEKQLLGREFRVIVLDQKILLAYEKTAASKIRLKDGLINPALNLQAGGQVAKVFAAIHPAWSANLTKLVADLNLRYAGLDLIADGSLDQPPGQYWLLEVNTAPAFDHFAALGPTALDQVRQILQSVLGAANLAS